MTWHSLISRQRTMEFGKRSRESVQSFLTIVGIGGINTPADCLFRACPTKPRSEAFVENFLIANFIGSGRKSIKFTTKLAKNALLGEEIRHVGTWALPLSLSGDAAPMDLAILASGMNYSCRVYGAGKATASLRQLQGWRQGCRLS